VSPDDPDKFKKAVHLMDIHAEKGMHCSDCHFARDNHGNGQLLGEVAQSVEIRCQDCHGNVMKRADLRTSGPAAPEGGTDLSLLRTPFGDQRFEWRGNELFQHSAVTEGMEWKVKQVRDVIDPASKDYNPKAARAKLARKLDASETRPGFMQANAVNPSHL